MLTKIQVKEIVSASLDAAGAAANDTGTLSEAGVDAKSLRNLVVSLVSSPTAGVPRFQHILDPNKIVSDIGLDTTIPDLEDKVARLSVGRFCSNPNTPHSQQCCPYPSVCPICGFKVL